MTSGCQTNEYVFARINHLAYSKIDISEEDCESSYDYEILRHDEKMVRRVLLRKRTTDHHAWLAQIRAIIKQFQP
jgi:sigma54-dependent transcription regulator